MIPGVAQKPSGQCVRHWGSLGCTIPDCTVVDEYWEGCVALVLGMTAFGGMIESFARRMKTRVAGYVLGTLSET